MTDVYHELIDALSETPGRLNQLLKDWTAAGPRSNEEWGPAEVVAHLLDVERLYRGHMQEILRRREGAVLHQFDEQRTAREHDYAASDLALSLGEFAAERGETMSLLINLALKDWDRAGILDPEGQLSIEDLAERLVDHDAEHLAQIEAGITRG